MENNDVHLCPCLELAVPMRDRRQWSNDQEWAANAICRMDLVQECYGLYRLSKTHLIGHDTCLLIKPTVEQPVQTFHLILSELIAMFEGGRFFQLSECAARRTWELTSFLRRRDDLPSIELVNLGGIELQDIIPQLPSGSVVRRVAPFNQEKDLNLAGGCS